MRESIKDNTDKIKNNKQLPYLVGNVVEVSLPFISLLSSKNSYFFFLENLKTDSFDSNPFCSRNSSDSRYRPR